MPLTHAARAGCSSGASTSLWGNLAEVDEHDRVFRLHLVHGAVDGDGIKRGLPEDAVDRKSR